MSETEKETSVDVTIDLPADPERCEASRESRREGENVAGGEDSVGGDGGEERKEDSREEVELTVVVSGGENGVSGDGGEGGEGGEGEESGAEGK